MVVIERRSFAGSNLGGIRATLEMLDFCAALGITANIELLNIQGIYTAY